MRSEQLIHFALRAPLTVILIFLVPAALGYIALHRLPIERFPKTSSPTVEIRVSYPGAAPEDVERQVTEVIEGAVSGITGAEHITSTSSQGSANVSIAFSEDTDLTTAGAVVERRISSVRRRLPAGTGEPAISSGAAGTVPVLAVELMSDRLSLKDLHQIATERVAPQLQSVPGVADVSVSGGLRSEIQVRVDPSRMQSRAVTLAQIQSAVRNWNTPSPAATARSDTQIFNTRIPARAERLSDLDEIVVATSGGGPVYLRDVASAVRTNDVQTSFHRFNHVDSVGLRITHQKGENGLRVDAELRERLKAFLESSGQSMGLTTAITSAPARLPRAAIDDTARSLFLAALVAGLVLILFLHNLWNALIVLIAIPATLLPTVFVVSMLGFSLDVVSLMALALVVGILVDDSIVVIESIHRRLKLAETAREATLHALSEVGPATIASTLISLALFVAMAFVGGNAGRLLREFGLVAAVAASFSLLVSLVLVPTVSSWAVGTRGQGSGPGGQGSGAGGQGIRRLTAGTRLLEEGYRAVVGRILRFGWLPVLLGFALLDLVFAPGFVRTEFAPREDTSRFSLTVALPPGTVINVTDAAARIVEERLARMREVVALSTTVREQSATIEVELVDKSERVWSVSQIATDVRDLGADIPNAATRTSVPSPLGGGGGSDLKVVVRGPALNVLETITNEVLRIVATAPGTGEVATSAFDSVLEYRAIVDPQRAADLGVSRQVVASTLNAATSGADVSTFRLEDGTQVDVVVQLDRALTPGELGALPIQTSRGTSARLDQVATIVSGTTLRQITRYDGQRQVSIAADRPPEDAMAEISKRLDQLRIPAGYEVRIVEEPDLLRVALVGLSGAIAISAVFMFVVLLHLYGSLLYPWAVMLSVPVALVGGFVALRMSGNAISVFTAMGMVVLVALVAKHAILLVDSANRLRRARGMAGRAAVLEASSTRVRPVLMSGVTIGCALVPLASSAAAGAESRAPLAVVVIGGLIASILVTLVMLPCLYTYLDDLQGALSRATARRRGGAVGQPASVPAEQEAAAASGDGHRAASPLIRRT